MPKGARGGRARKQVHAERTTRSSKAKNLQYGLEDPEQAEKQLTAQLKAMGLYAANTLGDGNCLFRALSDQLYGYPNQHLHIRHAICDYLQSHPEKYAGFVDDAKPFDAYVRNMREQGTYGGHLELSAFAQLKRKEIKIVQPNLVYVVAADDESEPNSSQQASEPGPSQAVDTQEPPLTTRQLRRLKREAKSGQTSEQATGLPSSATALEPIANPGSAPGPSSLQPASSTASVSAPSTAQASQIPLSATSASTSAAHAPSQPSPSKLSLQASSSVSRTVVPSPSKSAVKVPTPATPLVEANGPLYIAYHNWEHYSSIRNLDGPHSGLPKIRERPINQEDLAKEFSTIAAKAARRGGVLSKGKAKANTRPGTSSLDAEQPTEEEKLVMDSAPGHSLFEVRQLLKLLGSWEDVVEKLVAEDGAEAVPRRAQPVPPPAAVAPAAGGCGESSRDDVIVITDDEEVVALPSPAATANGVGAPPVVHQVEAIRNAAAASAASVAVAPPLPDAVWRAGSPSSVGTAASARSNVSMLTAGTSTSTSTVPTSDDWNAGESASSGVRTPAVGISGGGGGGGVDGLASLRGPKAGRCDEDEDDNYLALSPDSTLTAREFSIMDDPREQTLSRHLPGASATVASAAAMADGRMSPSAFKRKAHHGHDVGADGDDDSEMSHKRFSPARTSLAECDAAGGQHGGRVQQQQQQRVVPSSVSRSSLDGTTDGSSPAAAADAVGAAGRSVPVANAAVGRIVKSGHTRLDAISVGSGSSSDSDVPIGLLRAPVPQLAAVSSSQDSGSGSGSERSLPRLIPPSQQAALQQRRQQHPRGPSAAGGSGTSTDDDSIASSRPRRSSAAPIDYRASALGRTGNPGPGQQPVSLANAATQSKRAKRDQKRAEKVERERAKARVRRLGRGLGVGGDEDDEDAEEDAEGGAAAAVPAQFAFRELRI